MRQGASLTTLDLQPLLRRAFELEPIMQTPASILTAIQTPAQLVLVLRIPALSSVDIGVEIPLPAAVGDARWVAWAAEPDDAYDWVRLSVLIPVTELIETQLSRAQRVGGVAWLPTDMFELG